MGHKNSTAAPAKTRSNLLPIACSLAAFFVAAGSAQATKFTGEVNTLWSNDANWEGGFGPGNAAVIPSGKLVDLDIAVGIGSVTMEPDSNIRNAGGSLSVSGSFDFQGGTIGVDCQDPQLPVTIGSNGRLSFSGTAGKGISSCVVIQNAGQIEWFGGPIYFDGVLNNAGTFLIHGNGGFGSANRTGVINNTGRIEKVGGNGTTQFAGFTPETNSIATALNNQGVVAVSSGTIEMGPGTSNGEFNIAAGKKLLVSQDHTFDEAIFTGAGTCSLTATMTFLGHVSSTADIELTGVINGGTMAFPAAFVEGSGRLLWKSGRLTGTLTLDEGIHSILSEGAVKEFNGTITNKGTMDWMGGGPLASNSSTFHNAGTFNVLAGGFFLADTYINGSGFENTGTLNTFAGGTSQTDDNFMTNSGTVNIGGVGGTGIFRPRGFAQTATGKLNMEVGGANGSTPDFDQILGGSIQIDGVLNVAVINNYTPPKDARFTLVDSHGGKFAQVSLPGPQGRFSIEDPGNAPTVLVSNSDAPLPGPTFDLWAAGRDLATNELPDRGTDAQATNQKIPQWSYGYRSEITGGLTLFTSGEHQNGLGNPDVDGWSSGPNGNAVSVSVNTGSAPVTINSGAINSGPLRPGQLLMLPTPSNFAVARWTASESGTYNIAARWVDADATGGNGAAAYVVVNGTQIFGGQDASSKLYTGARWPDGGKVAMAPRSLRLVAGDTIDFVVGSNGDSGNDLTAVNAVIRRAPEVTISAPQTSLPGQDVTVTVASSTPLTGVSLRQDGSIVRTLTETPFEFVLKDLTPGIYHLQAEGVTADKILGASNVVTLTVNDAPVARLARGKAATAATGSTYEAITSGTWNQADIWRRKSDNANGIPGPNDVAIIPASVQIVLDSNRTIGKAFCEGIIAGEDGTTGRELTANKQLSISGLARDLTLHIATTAVLTNVKGSAFFENVNVLNEGRMVISQSLFASGSAVTNKGSLNLLTPPASGGPVILQAPHVQLAGAVRLTPGTAIAGLVGLDSGTLVGNDGSTLVGNDGSTLVGNDGSTLVGNDGSTLVGNDGSTLVGNDGSTLVGNDGSTLVGNDGSTLVGNDGSTLAQVNAAALVGNDGASRPASRLHGEPQSGIVVDGGILAGTCNLIGNVSMAGGFITPGKSAGTIVVAGDLSLDSNSTTVLEIGGNNTQPSASDKLSVLGNANLDGKLIVRTINGYSPQPNDTIEPLTYSSKSGAFDSISSNAQVTFGAEGATVAVNGPNPPAPKALNISTRARVETGDNVLIGGFIITGADPKKVIIRAIGPSLATKGVANSLVDPTLELHSTTALLASNDNWRSDHEGEIVATSLAPTDDRESAIVATLAPGAYTAVMRGKANSSGVGLVEVYDLASATPVQLANISTRGFVQTGENVLIGGFILGGNYPAKVVVRGLGPSLSAAHVPNPLQDPVLQLVDKNGNMLTNDNWRSAQESEILASGLALTDDREAIIVSLLAPGEYTAIVRGKDDTTGVALVEAYTLP